MDIDKIVTEPGFYVFEDEHGKENRPQGRGQNHWAINWEVIQMNDIFIILIGTMTICLIGLLWPVTAFILMAAWFYIWWPREIKP